MSLINPNTGSTKFKAVVRYEAIVSLAGAKSKVTYQAELEKDDRGQWVFDSFWLNE